MILYPAIDLKDGQCVRLYKGEMDQATVFSPVAADKVRAPSSSVSAVAYVLWCSPMRDDPHENPALLVKEVSPKERYTRSPVEANIVCLANKSIFPASTPIDRPFCMPIDAREETSAEPLVSNDENPDASWRSCAATLTTTSPTADVATADKASIRTCDSTPLAFNDIEPADESTRPFKDTNSTFPSPCKVIARAEASELPSEELSDTD